MFEMGAVISIFVTIVQVVAYFTFCIDTVGYVYFQMKEIIKEENLLLNGIAVAAGSAIRIYIAYALSCYFWR